MTILVTVAETRKRALAGVGRVIVWPGASLWAGRHMGHVREHAHHAIQTALALEGRFSVRGRSWPEARETAGMMVMPGRLRRHGRHAVRRTQFDPGRGTAQALWRAGCRVATGRRIRGLRRPAANRIPVGGVRSSTGAVRTRRHLFVAQTGTSFRARLLWARAEYAIAAAQSGMSWTDASLHAGFADAAHFTRTCRRVFGIAPSMLAFEQLS